MKQNLFTVMALLIPCSLALGSSLPFSERSPQERVIILLLGLVFWLLYSSLKYLVAIRLKHPNPEFAWIPLFQIFVLCDLAGVGRFWTTLGYLIPYSHPFVAAYLGYSIAKQANKTPVLFGFFLGVPIVDIYVLLELARPDRPQG